MNLSPNTFFSPFKIITIFLFVACLTCANEENAKKNYNWDIPKKFAKLAPHPRLFVSKEQIARMVKGRGDKYKDAYEKVQKAADEGVKDAENPIQDKSPYHKGFLIQGRLTSLAIEWFRTKDRKYLEAAVKNIQGMKDWIKIGQQIQLWEGQMIAGIAVAYDLLYNDMTPEERNKVVEVGHHFAKAWLMRTGNYEKELGPGETGTWWMGRISNWNPVCSSGAGMLGLAMYEELPESQTLINRVKKSYEPIFKELEKTKGGWVEGLGYWNWAMHYISLFGISYERATGSEYPEFRSDGFKKTLTFGVCFVPHGIACGFGDNNHGNFSSSLYAAAEHLKYQDVLALLQGHSKRMQEAKQNKKNKKKEKVNIGYGIPQNLLIEPDPLTDSNANATVKNMVKYFPEQGWGMIADQWPDPNIFAAVKGGFNQGDHTHKDLLSWHAVIGKERVIANSSGGSYYPTVFRGRANEVYERNQTSKNSLFISGISVYSENSQRFGVSKANITALQFPTGPALNLEARDAFFYGNGWYRPKIASRLFAVIKDKALLVVDRVVSREKVPVEARAHTELTAEFGEDFVVFEGKEDAYRMSFASNRKFTLRKASALKTSGRGKPMTMIRFQTLDDQKAVTMVSLITRGKDPVKLTVESENDNININIKAEDWQEQISLNEKLLKKN